MTRIKPCMLLFLLLFVIVNAATNTKLICNKTPYPNLCIKSLPDNNVKLQELYKFSVQVAMKELSRASHGLNSLRLQEKVNPQSCHVLFSAAMSYLNDSSTLTPSRADLNVWLTATGTHQQRCVNAVRAARDATLRRAVLKHVEKWRKLTVNSLTIQSIAQRRLSEFHGGAVDIVVAKDGSGKFKTIGEALKAVPSNSPKRVVIYVKKGVYTENVKVEREKTNVMMYGDGMDATIITGNRNNKEGTPTYDSATFAVMASDFVGKNMGIRNTAGLGKGQAIALLATGDKGVFYQCKFEGYQDTLCANDFRQFFRQCTISDTIDFIFGSADAVFQNCNILLRKPMPGQGNVIIAQGKSKAPQKSGFAIQDCTISPAENLDGVPTFLARPWGPCSTIIFIHTTIPNVIDPKGYSPFRGDTAPNTIYFAEFENKGPGAGTTNRVKWKGVHVGVSSADATKFTVQTFLQGGSWIPSTGVPYKPGL